MNIQLANTDKFSYLVIDDMYDENELKEIWEELEYLTHPRRMKGPGDTHSATEKGEYLKDNVGLFLDVIFQNDRESSNILNANKKIFGNKDINDVWLNAHPYNVIWEFLNGDYTMVSYYENNHHYKEHHDHAQFTVLTWFFKEPKQFNGGDFSFSRDNIDIEVKNNRTIIFPSWVKHRVSPVTMKEGFEYGDKEPGFSTYGRYCMTQFLHNHAYTR